MEKNTKYYRWLDENTLEEFRIIGFQNENTIRVKYTRGPLAGEIKKVDSSIIKNEDYIKLAPDLVLSIVVSELSESLNDVIVTVVDPTKIDEGIIIVCRQCITDIFASQFNNKQKQYYGLSISTDSCPADVPFENFLACNSIKSSEIISWYIGDTIDDIVEVASSNYDKYLTLLFLDHCKSASKGVNFVYKQMIEKQYVDGYCKSLKSLLSINNFMYDLYHAKNIIQINMDNLDQYDNNAAPANLVEVLSFLNCKNIVKSLLLKYDKDIDLSLIKLDYQLIADSNDNIYVVVYKADGEYHVPVENTESAENIEKLNATMRTKSIQDAFDILNLSKSKYDDIL